MKHKNIEEYNPDKEHKMLTVFHDMIANMLSNKKGYPIVTELFIRGIKLNISFDFIFLYQKNITINCKHDFIVNVTNKWELQQVTFNHLSNIRYEYFLNLYLISTGKPYSF